MYQIVPFLLALFACMYELQLVGIPSPTVISFGTNSYTLYLFDLIHIMKLVSAFSYMYQFPVVWTSKFYTFQGHSGSSI